MFSLVFETGMAILSLVGNICRFDGRGIFALYNCDEKNGCEALIIVFYDGDCGICQRSILFLYRVDKKKKLLFAPLNGPTYIQIYGEKLTQLNSLKLYYDHKTFEKSSALIELCHILGGGYKFIRIFSLIPKSIRDYIYDLIASNRKPGACLILNKDKRFLD